ncbi:hypothetical protein TNCV_1419111 [Trichonephila clavipes]|nr:hypothetical protein TNCV_1419111 [Trichonephila clavipes]
MHMHAFQDVLFIGYKQSLDNPRSIAFSQRTSNTHLIKDETFNDSNTVNDLKGYENGHEEPGGVNINVALFSYTRAFGDGPRNFEPWPSDTCAGTPCPNYYTTLTGGRFSSQ